MVNKKFVIGGLIVAAVVLVFIVISSTGRLTGFTVTSPIKTCRNVEVPYQATEEYRVPLKYEVVSTTKDTTLHGFDVWATADVDSETGTFTVTQTFKTLNRQPQTLQSSQYIMPAEMKGFHHEFDINLGEDFNVDYTITPSEKILTRTITKYRTEQKCD